MVVCKYYRQGNCRFGQYCQFEHINTFGSNTKTDSYNEDEYTAVLVAKEVLSAERGGQWMLSCFAPLKERPCIPGMEDVSPEEVRWEMYQAQKTGMVEQAKLHYQQLCRDMKAKREALKNPTRETLTKLKEILGTGNKNTRNDNTSGKSSNFAFATPHLGLPSSTPSTNVFHPFSGSFTSSNNTSIFGRSTTTSNPVFGQNTQNFGSTNTIFGGGGTSQPVFGKPSIFGTNNQTNNVFARPQTSQTPTSVFNSGPTSSPSLFSGTSTQSNTSIFGGAKTTTANPFSGSSNLQTTNSMFGTTPSAGTFNSGMFSQAETTPAFGAGPVFGGTTAFGNATNSIFGEKPTFASSAGIFSGSNTTTSSFSSTQPTNAFGVTTSTPSVNIFGNTQSTTPAMSTSNAPPFGTTPSTTAGPFSTATSQFETTSTTSLPKLTFGTGGTVSETFGTTVTPTSTPFGTTNTNVGFGTTNTTATPFTPSTFGGDTKSSPFSTTSVTTTTTVAMSRIPSQLQAISSFSTLGQSQTSNTAPTSTNRPFGESPFGVTQTTVFNETIYSTDDQLTDDEKSMYLAEKFTFGKIPLKPPTAHIR
ncbi:unnamed protein product [Xylocopa violacea]|uniref:Nucleoporin NUP42 n=1 Tax=Xylocopa violacea TaxID=135666 RepID=A0ABP1NJW4_XYLVO